MWIICNPLDSFLSRRWFIAQQSVKEINAINNKWSFDFSSLGKVKWSLLDRTALVTVKLCTAGDVARMGTLSASIVLSITQIWYSSRIPTYNFRKPYFQPYWILFAAQKWIISCIKKCRCTHNVSFLLHKNFVKNQKLQLTVDWWTKGRTDMPDIIGLPT